MTHLRALILTVSVLFTASANGVSAEAIRIAVNAETAQRVVARIAGVALQEAGFAVEYVSVTAATQYSVIASGDVHVQPDATDATDSPDYQAGVASGRIVDMGQTVTRKGDSKSRKIMWAGVSAKWPGAAKLLRNMTLPTGDQIALATAIDEEGRDIDEVVNEWMNANTKRWKFWTAASTNWMKQ